MKIALDKVARGKPLPKSLPEGKDLSPFAAQVHAEPHPAVILADVVEKENAI
jgi:hypothetical protein